LKAKWTSRGGLNVLYLFIQFVGHMSQGGLMATNFGRCHASPIVWLAEFCQIAKWHGKMAGKMAICEGAWQNLAE
jgi:hypothetical protein